MAKGNSGHFTGTKGEISSLKKSILRLSSSLPKDKIKSKDYIAKIKSSKPIEKGVPNKKTISLGQMPNYKNAITPKEKFFKYSLDKSNPKNGGKAIAYEKGLGYNMSNGNDLIRKIDMKVKSGKYLPYSVETTQYGTKYSYRFHIKGLNGKIKYVIAVYQIDNLPNPGNPRMITNYLEKEGKKHD